MECPLTGDLRTCSSSWLELPHGLGLDSDLVSEYFFFFLRTSSNWLGLPHGLRLDSDLVSDYSFFFFFWGPPRIDLDFLMDFFFAPHSECSGGWPGKNKEKDGISPRKSLTAKVTRPFHAFNPKKYIDHYNIAPLSIESALKSNNMKEWGAPCSTPFVIIRLANSLWNGGFMATWPKTINLIPCKFY